MWRFTALRSLAAPLSLVVVLFSVAPAFAAGGYQFLEPSFSSSATKSGAVPAAGPQVPYPSGLVTTPLGQGLASEVEPNNTSATATPLGGSNVVFLGNVFPAADVDFYSFTAAAGDQIHAAVQTLFDASQSGDSVLDLIDTDGTTVIESDNNDGTFNASSSNIAGRTIAAPGTYFLRVRHNSATGTLRPYYLHFNQLTGAPTPEVESNNTPATANPLPASGWVSGTITAVSPGESDFFSLNLAAGDSVYLSLDMNPERDAAVWNGRLGFALFGNPPANQILLANDANAGANPADPNSEAFFFTVLTAGTYYVYVDSIVAAGLGANATYTLSVAVHPEVPATPNCTTYTSTDVPKTIPATAPPITVSSTLTVPGNPRIADLDVTINLNHTFMQDLDFQLMSPAGNDNGLLTDIGAATVGGAQTLMDLRLDDEAALPPAFALSSSFVIQPELSYRLGWFDGEDAGGTWTLVLRDDANGDGGTLNAWSLTICEPPPPPSCAPGFVPTTVFSTDFESGDAGFTHSGTQDEWELGLPATAATTTANPVAAITTCNSGNNCWKTDLDNTYNVSSSQDLLSPNINLAGLSPPVLVSWAQRYQIETATFDHYNVSLREVGNPSNLVRFFEHLDATMTNGVGAAPTVNIGESSGWSIRAARADALAGLNTELLFHLDSDNSVNFAGAAVDDVSVTACRQLSADLSITKTDGVTDATPGGSVTYTITASNAGTDPVTGATVADTFPASLTCSWTCSGAGGGTCTAGPVAGNINDSVDLPVGGSATYTATCTISAAATGSLVNTATVSSAVADPNSANNSATDTDTLTPSADLAITKTDGVGQATPGGMTTYTITASNAGPSNVPSATVADTFPASLSCSWTCSGAGGGTCTAGPVAGNINDPVSLPAGGSVTYTAVCSISAAATGTLVNTATVSSGVGDPNGANNSATDNDELIPSADLSITKTDGVGSVNPGGMTTYTIVASNAGPSNAPSSTVADTFPATLTCTWTCSGAGGGTCTAGPVAGNINDSVNLPAGGSVTYTAVCAVDGGASGTIVNTATVTGSVGDPNSANNSATDTDTVNPAASADLSITKTDGLTNAMPGQPIQYTIVVSNAGPSAANGATVSDTFPMGLIAITWTCAGSGGGTCTAGPVAGNINDSVNLPAAGSVTYTVNATIDLGFLGVLTNTATVSAPGGVPDPNSANNSATDTTNVVGAAMVTGTKTVSGDFEVGGTIFYEVILTNNGTANQPDNPGNEFEDVLPAELTLVSATATSGTANANVGTNTVTWNGSLAANGGSVTITITATINDGTEGMVISNQGTIFFDGDGNGTNEASDATDDPSTEPAGDPTEFPVAGGPGPNPAEIPTLSEVGLAALALLLAAAATVALRRRRRV